MRVPFIWTLVASLTVLPTAVQATDLGTVEPETVVLQNVELSANGIVNGQLVDDAGKPLAGELVQVQTKTGLQKLRTDKDGHFNVASKKGGNCVVSYQKRAFACRLWEHGTAPPKALTSFTVVHTDGPIVRAQDCGEGCDDSYGGRRGRLGGVTGGQLLGLGLLAGAVVAIVIAVENDDDAS